MIPFELFRAKFAAIKTQFGIGSVSDARREGDEKLVVDLRLSTPRKPGDLYS